MTNKTGNGRGLKARLNQDGVLIAPGVYDMISLRIAAASGAEVLYMTGFGTVASHLGLPDAGLASYRDMVSRAAMMAEQAAEFGLPFVADGDTGYGGLLNVAHTVRGYEKAGVSAIQLEDQTFPKKCGHTPGRGVIPVEEMVDKIKVAAESRASDDFLIIARTDARSSQGLQAAIDRAAAYGEAGADLLFVESPESVEELETVGRSLSKPLVANMVEGGRTPILGKAELDKLGFSLALFPATGFLATGAALFSAYRQLIEKQGGTVEQPLLPFSEFNEMIGFPAVWEFDKRHARD